MPERGIPLRWSVQDCVGYFSLDLWIHDNGAPCRTIGKGDL